MEIQRRTYRMKVRAEATAATHDAILDAATEQFLGRWYDEVSLAGIAQQAGVSSQTVINHFGSKERLMASVVERIGPEAGRRAPGDDPVAGVVEDYETGGDTVIRMLALEERIPALAGLLGAGRAGHRAWVQEAFADRLPAGGPEREQALAVHVAATDIYVWKLLRRDMGMSREDTIEAMRRLVDGLNPRTEV
jgi:AcrR family transcriptional regulator